MPTALLKATLSLLISSLAIGPASAQPTFTVVPDEIGLPKLGQDSAAWADYNNDGRPDLLIAPEGFQHFLRYNQGNGKYLDQNTTLSFMKKQNASVGTGVIFADYDNDGDLDLYLPIGEPREYRFDALMRNDGDTFRNVAVESGLIDSLPSDNALWLDYDRDGWLDLYVGHWKLGLVDSDVAIITEDPPLRNKLYRNQGDGTFIDATALAGLNISMHPNNSGTGFGMVAADFDDDGWPDLYVGVFEGPNRLFFNNADGTFRDGTTDEIGDLGKAHGVAVGDIDNDGDLEIFQATGGSFAILGGFPQRAPMLLNLGAGEFLDVTEGVGLSPLRGIATTKPHLEDLDNDGDLDLLVTDPGFIFLNNGAGEFVDWTDRTGIYRQGEIESLGDYDQDGFIDLRLTEESPGEPRVTSTIYRNNGNNNHWLRVDPVGTRSNRDGIGTRLIARAGDLTQTRQIIGGTGFFQPESIAHFGLGPHNKVDQLEIHWPSGQIDTLTDLPVDRRLRVFEGHSDYQEIRPTTVHLAADSLVINTVVDFRAVVHPAPFEAGARVEAVTADLSKLGAVDAIPMTANDDGSYRLQSPIATGPFNTHREVRFTIVQNTSLGPYRTDLVQRVTILPATDAILYADAPDANWTVAPNNQIAVDFASTSPVFTGTSAMAHTAEGNWLISYTPTEPIVPIGYTALHLAFHRGDAMLPEDNARFQISLASRTIPLLDHLDLSIDGWQVIELPFADFAIDTPIDRIRLIGNFQGIFHLDDLRFIAAVPGQPTDTAIREDHTSTQPQVFTLAQNYPNPFNAQTIIRFALPQTTDVELTVYNMTGQKVVTLMEGIRKSGSYAVHWDGRDNDGRTLASGIYLYRLRMQEGHHKTQKLLLLR